MKRPRQRPPTARERQAMRAVIPVIEGIIGLATIAVLVSRDDPQGHRVRTPAALALHREDQRRRRLQTRDLGE